VLQRVFGTEIYQDVEKQLEEMRKAAKREVEAAQGTLGRALARFHEAVGLDGEELARLEEHAAALRLEELGTAAQEHLRSADDAARSAVQERRTAAAAEAAARAHAEETARALTRIDRRRELDALSARLDASDAQIRTARERLARDEAARPVDGLLQRRDRAAAESAAREKDLTELTEATRSDHPSITDLLAGEDAPAALAAAAEEDTSRGGALTDLVTLESGLGEREEALAARAEASTRAARALEELDETIAARPAAKQLLTDSRDQARRRAGALADARVAQRTAEQRLQAARSAAAQQTALEQAAEVEAQALRSAQLAAETETDLRTRRFAGIAAELALDLDEGEECPVCGATSHPHRATATKDAVDAEQVSAAETARQQAERSHAEAAQKRALFAGEVEALRERAGDLDVPAAQAAHDAAAAQVQEIEAAQQEAERLETEIARHDEKTEQLTERRARDALALERERTAHQEASTALEADRARVVDARGDADSIAARRGHHTARARAATALREALRAASDAAARAGDLTEEAERARTSAEEQLHGAADGLPDDAAVRSAVLPEDERRALSSSLQQRAIDESRLADGLAEEGIAGTDASEEARADAGTLATAAREQHTAAQQAAEDAAALATRQSAIAERAASARRALDGAMGEVREVSDRAGVVVRVADLATARSADGRRIPLSTFVLMRRFEDVVDAANARLARFSGTDLELLRDDGARGARKTGLDLLVMDRRTDQARVPETLSGGETFFVSLALALGLADIVTGEAGGVRMETLFIDEGFGSLDPQTLETVVAEIGHLSQHGRTIGIVSHVGDLKSQIAEQVHVRRIPSGPSTVSITA
jgi:exonuclease SbcC